MYICLSCSKVFARHDAHLFISLQYTQFCGAEAWPYNRVHASLTHLVLVHVCISPLPFSGFETIRSLPNLTRPQSPPALHAHRDYHRCYHCYSHSYYHYHHHNNNNSFVRSCHSFHLPSNRAFHRTVPQHCPTSQQRRTVASPYPPPRHAVKFLPFHPPLAANHRTTKKSLHCSLLQRGTT